MCGCTRKDKILEEFVLAPIMKKMTNNCLRWFGHIQRMTSEGRLQGNFSLVKRTRRETRRTDGGNSEEGSQGK